MLFFFLSFFLISYRMPIKRYIVLSSLFSIAYSEPLINELTKTEQFHAILKSLKAAFFISFHFFKIIFSFIFTFTRLFTRPIYWILNFTWTYLIRKPLALFSYANSTLYPIILFCLAAAACGLFIGGCAGFASEAFSSVVITATWGPQSKKSTKQEDELVTESLDTKEEDEKKEMKMNRWDPGSLYHKFNKEHWKESVTTASRLSPPVLIRRMRLSSTPIRKTRKNSWNWDEDEQDLIKKSICK